MNSTNYDRDAMARFARFRAVGLRLAGDHVGVDGGGSFRFGWSVDELADASAVVRVGDSLYEAGEPRPDATLFFVDAEANAPYRFGEHRANWDVLHTVGGGHSLPVERGDLCVAQTGGDGRSGTALGVVVAINELESDTPTAKQRRVVKAPA